MFFTRYELLKLLNWADTTRNYHRLEQSLNRWLGVTLYYEKAWWSKEEQSWVNEGFHILDHVQILDQERQRRAAKRDIETTRGRVPLFGMKSYLTASKPATSSRSTLNSTRVLKAPFQSACTGFSINASTSGSALSLIFERFAASTLGFQRTITTAN